MDNATRSPGLPPTGTDEPAKGEPASLPPEAGTSSVARGAGDERPTTPEAPAAPSGPAAVGRRVGRYELLAEIAHGGMGVVYKAQDTRVGRPVALKIVRAGVFAQPEEVERFCREAQAVVRLGHPHIVQVYDVGYADERPYFTMQLAPGGSLAQHLARFTPDPRAAVALVEKVARAVEHAHRRGILHRDLKPANVLLGAGDEPLVADFGLAKFLDADADGLTQTGVTPGTPSYMAPEQAAGRRQEVSPCTDVWALGVILYELLTGRRPIIGGSREEILHRILTTAPPRPRELRPDLDAALEAVVLRCLEKDPARRYASAGDLADELGRWLRGELPAPAGPGRPGGLRQMLRGHPVRSTAAALCLAIALALGAALLWPRLRPAAPPVPGEAPPLVLIGEGRPLPVLNWIAGEQGAVVEPADEGLAIHSPGTCVLELLPAPPWERYRLEAEVRHDATRHGSVGVYFGSGGHPSGQGPFHLLCSVGFADQGNLTGRMDTRLWRMPDDAPAQYAAARCADHPFDGAARAGVPAPWRPLAVEVGPEEIRLFFDGQYVGTLSPAEIGRRGSALFADAPSLTWDAVPQGGIGLYIDTEGAATFRHVAVRPLSRKP
jgi:serine/threonine-protein kinase